MIITEILKIIPHKSRNSNSNIALDPKILLKKGKWKNLNLFNFCIMKLHKFILLEKGKRKKENGKKKKKRKKKTIFYFWVIH